MSTESTLTIEDHINFSGFFEFDEINSIPENHKFKQQPTITSISNEEDGTGDMSAAVKLPNDFDKWMIIKRKDGIYALPVASNEELAALTVKRIPNPLADDEQPEPHLHVV
jgi:hypothetical protein